MNSCCTCQTVPNEFISLQCDHDYCLPCLSYIYLQFLSEFENKDQIQSVMLQCNICKQYTQLDEQSIQAMEDVLQQFFIQQEQENIETDQNEHNQLSQDSNQKQDYIENKKNYNEMNKNQVQKKQDGNQFFQNYSSKIKQTALNQENKQLEINEKDIIVEEEESQENQTYTQSEIDLFTSSFGKQNIKSIDKESYQKNQLNLKKSPQKQYNQKRNLSYRLEQQNNKDYNYQQPNEKNQNINQLHFKQNVTENNEQSNNNFQQKKQIQNSPNFQKVNYDEERNKNFQFQKLTGSIINEEYQNHFEKKLDLNQLQNKQLSNINNITQKNDNLQRQNLKIEQKNNIQNIDNYQTNFSNNQKQNDKYSFEKNVNQFQKITKIQKDYCQTCQKLITDNQNQIHKYHEVQGIDQAIQTKKTQFQQSIHQNDDMQLFYISLIEKQKQLKQQQSLFKQKLQDQLQQIILSAQNKCQQIELEINNKFQSSENELQNNINLLLKVLDQNTSLKNILQETDQNKILNFEILDYSQQLQSINYQYQIPDIQQFYNYTQSLLKIQNFIKESSLENQQVKQPIIQNLDLKLNQIINRNYRDIKQQNKSFDRTNDKSFDQNQSNNHIEKKNYTNQSYILPDRFQSQQFEMEERQQKRQNFSNIFGDFQTKINELTSYKIAKSSRNIDDLQFKDIKVLEKNNIFENKKSFLNYEPIFNGFQNHNYLSNQKPFQSPQRLEFSSKFQNIGILNRISKNKF